MNKNRWLRVNETNKQLQTYNRHQTIEVSIQLNLKLKMYIKELSETQVVIKQSLVNLHVGLKEFNKLK